MNWKRIGYQCLAILTPLCWIRNGTEVDYKWDQQLWQAIEQGRISHVGEFSAIIDDQLVWIENYPYASGTLNLASDNRKSARYCSRATALYLHRSLDEARIMDRLRGLDKFTISKVHISLM